MGASRPAALTHSPTPGWKKCGVLSKGFLASKSKPALSLNSSIGRTCGMSQEECWFESNLSESGLLPDRTQGAGDKPSLWAKFMGQLETLPQA